MSAKHTPGPRDADRTATQRHTIFGALVRHCGQPLTPDRIDQITDEIMREIEVGGTAWAFAKATGSESVEDAAQRRRAGQTVDANGRVRSHFRKATGSEA